MQLTSSADTFFAEDSGDLQSMHLCVCSNGKFLTLEAVALDLSATADSEVRVYACHGARLRIPKHPVNSICTEKLRSKVFYQIAETTLERRGKTKKEGANDSLPPNPVQVSRCCYFADLGHFAICLSTYRVTDLGNAVSPRSFLA
jgi:hypothetical protein